MPERIIPRTDEVARLPWPEDMFIQGGKSGLVFRKDGSTYTTAFVEASPPGTFLRGEGATVAEAEGECWLKYQRYCLCSDGTGEHGPFEPRKYRNGSGFCTKCGTWMSKVLPVLPEDPDREPGIIEQLLKMWEDDEEDEQP